MTWRDSAMLALDFETSSADPEQARIVTACAGSASSAGWEPAEWLLRQDAPIPAEATAIHGITTEKANAHGRPAAECVLEVRNVLLTAWSLGQPVVGFNICYDLTVLDRESRRHGHGPLPILGPVIDGLVLDKAIDKFRRGSRKLVDVCAHYGITLDGAHDSTADALASARLAWKLALLLPNNILQSDPTELTRWQETQYADQRRSFAEYRRRKGEPLDDESTDWPIRPMPDRSPSMTALYDTSTEVDTTEPTEATS